MEEVQQCPACGHLNPLTRDSCENCLAPLTMVSSVLSRHRKQRTPQSLLSMQSRAAQLKDAEASASMERMEVFEDIDRRRITSIKEEEARRRLTERRVMKLVAGLFVFVLAVALVIFFSLALRG